MLRSRHEPFKRWENVAIDKSLPVIEQLIASQIHPDYTCANCGVQAKWHEPDKGSGKRFLCPRMEGTVRDYDPMSGRGKIVHQGNEFAFTLRRGWIVFGTVVEFAPNFRLWRAYRVRRFRDDGDI